MSDDRIDVWVEIFPESNDTKTASVKSVQTSHFRLGKVSKDAYNAADLMKKAQDSRKAAETAIAGASSRKKEDSALAKLQSFGGTKAASMNMGDRISVFVTLNTGEEVQAHFHNVYPSNKKILAGEAADLTGLTYLEEPNVLRSLQERYELQSCYTNIASILVAMNPYKRLDIYSAAYMTKYREAKPGAHPPHIFALAENAYIELNRGFSKRRQAAPTNQSIIVCGESGSGKTESAKYLMRFLANRAHAPVEPGSNDDSSHERLVERQVLEANHILEAFGNANTLLNHNSSRFGKFTRLYFATANVDAGSGQVVGASTTTYLLEKSRLVRQNPGERNFHVFYQLLSGLDSTRKAKLKLVGKEAKDFFYINQGSKFTVQGIDDAEWFTEMCHAMDVLGISKENCEDVFTILSGLLHLGNVKFKEDPDQPGGCIIDPSSSTHFHDAATLFGFGQDTALIEMFRKRLRTVRIKTPGEWISKNLNVIDANFNRDSIAKSMYDNLFKWLVLQINNTLSKTQDLPWIGILDVFGFESFANNSFEQFCINFANEMLQQHFNNAILLSEQKEYAKEAIMWTPINVPDNQDTIDLISGEATRNGILPLLDSACKMRGTSVEGFTDSLFASFGSHVRMEKVARKGAHKDVRNGFMIDHYAGKVVYNAEEFLIKNNDSKDPDSVSLFATSTVPTLVALFKDDEDDEPEITKTGRGRAKVQSNFSSVSATFKKQLKSLLEVLSTTESYFVRCIKPNTEYKSWTYDMDYVRPQLRCGGLVEAVRMLKIGFPTRVSFEQVYNQYSPLLHPQPKFPINRRDFSQAVLFLFGLRRTEYQLGLSKVFFRAGKRAFLETVMNRDEKLSASDMSALLGFIHRKRWQRVIATAKSHCILWRCIHIDRLIDNWRKVSRVAIIYRRTFIPLLRKIRKKDALISVQASIASYLARKKLLTILHASELEKQQEIMRQTALRAEIEKKEAEQAKKEADKAEALRLKQEEEERKENEIREKIMAKLAAEGALVGHGVASTSQGFPNVNIHHRRPTKGSLSGSISVDNRAYQDLEQENAKLKAELAVSQAEVERLMEVVEQLDEINNRLVEDLMNELVLRTQLTDEVAFSGKQQDGSTIVSPRLATGGGAAIPGRVNTSLEYVQGNVPLPPKVLVTRRSSLSGAPRRDTDCSIQ